MEEIVNGAAVIIGALTGVTLRQVVSLHAPQAYVESPLFAAFVPNVLGSGLIAVVQSWSPSPLKTMVSVGFCGCLTTFSSWMVAMSDSPELLVLMAFIGLACPMFAFKIVTQTGEELQRKPDPPTTDVFDTSEHPRPGPRSEYVALVVPLIIVYVLLSVFLESRYTIWVPALLGGPGALIRWKAAKINKPDFPLGTFICNMSGTAIVALVQGLLVSNRTKWNIWDSIVIGFGGSLTTVSSFITEVSVTDRKVYMAATIVFGILVAVVIYLPFKYT